MKKMILKRIFSLCLIILFSTTTVFSQLSTILGNFDVSQTKGKVFLNWQINAGSTCNGILILRSTDNINFIQIGEIKGICGSVSVPVNYSFTDENPVKNSFNNYRLELGNSGKSEILSLEYIDINNGGFQIRPNPVNTEAKIYFDNNKREQHYFFLYNLLGVQIANLYSKDDFFDFNANNFPAGIYFFTISDSKTVFKTTGRLIIRR